MSNNIYDINTTSDGGASIDDSTSSVTGTYSSAKIDADNAVQDARLVIETGSSRNISVPANAIGTVKDCVILNPDASSSEYDSNLRSIVAIGSLALQSATLSDNIIAIGNRTGSGSTVGESVLIGNDVGSNGAMIGGAVVIGESALSIGGEALSSVILGAEACNTTGVCTGSVIIGHTAGPKVSDTAGNVIMIGRNCNTGMRNYDDTGNLSLVDYDIVFGISDTDGSGQPLIHANGDPTGPHFSPGVDTASLGTADRSWSGLVLSSDSTIVYYHPVNGQISFTSSKGTKGMYDSKFWRNADAPGTQQGQNNASYYQAGNKIVYFETTPKYSNPHFAGNSNITMHSQLPVGADYQNIYSWFQNTSEEDRLWHLEINVTISGISGGILSNGQVYFIHSATPPGNIGSFGTSGINSYYRGFTQSLDSVPQYYLSTSATIHVPAGEYVWAVCYCGTNNWVISGPDSPSEYEAASLSITELPQ